SGFREAHPVRRLPWRRLDQAIEKLDRFRGMPRLFEQSRGWVKILERIADDHDKAPQEFQCTWHVAGGQANLSQAQKVSGYEIVLFNFARKDEFENLASRLLVAGLEKRSRSLAERFP